MSRIGKLPVILPAGVTVEIAADNTVSVKGPLGTLSQKVDSDIKVEVGTHIEKESQKEVPAVLVTRPTNQPRHRSMHGLYRALINNMVIGVSEGFRKELELVGVGYRVNDKPNNAIELLLGFTHPIYLQFPAEVKIETKSERNKNPLIILESCNKELLGLICAKIRSFRKPEPYKGKGVKFVGEIIRRKSGKSAGAK